MEIPKEFKELINGSAKKIVITTHQKPDADALGSSLGFASYLRKKGHQVAVISPTDYPAFLFWMDGNDDVIVFNEGNEKKAEKLLGEADLSFSLDYNSLHRIEDLGDIVESCDAIKVMIDHHLEPEDFADYKFWSTEAAATAELVFELIDGMGDKAMIDKDIAESLYAGIMTDTGGFRHTNTTRNIHLITAELIDRGADVSRVSKLIYDNNSLDRLKFLGFALSERLKVLPKLQVAYIAITAKDLKKFKSKTGDTEGLVNYALSIKGIKMAALIVDRQDGIKMSFRSIGNFSVNDLAREHFNGGGHKNAAGGISNDSFEETVNKFEKVVRQYRTTLKEEPAVA